MGCCVEGCSVNLYFFFASGIIAFLVGIEGERLLLMGRMDVKSICGSGRGW